MLCYRDMTFCEGDGCAKFQACHRAFTETHRANAKENGLPVSKFENPRELDCWSDQPVEKDEAPTLL